MEKWVTSVKNGSHLKKKQDPIWKNGSHLEKWVTFEKQYPSLKERVKLRKMGHRKSKSGCMGENQKS